MQRSPNAQLPGNYKRSPESPAQILPVLSISLNPHGLPHLSSFSVAKSGSQALHATVLEQSSTIIIPNTYRHKY
ncbi:hypothetical protein ACU8KH_05040 [Lachancea thermotolerans]